MGRCTALRLAVRRVHARPDINREAAMRPSLARARQRSITLFRNSARREERREERGGPPPPQVPSSRRRELRNRHRRTLRAITSPRLSLLPLSRVCAETPCVRESPSRRDLHPVEIILSIATRDARMARGAVEPSARTIRAAFFPVSPFPACPLVVSESASVRAAILREVLVYKEPLSPRRVARRLLPRRHPIPVPFRKAPCRPPRPCRSVHPFLFRSPPRRDRRHRRRNGDGRRRARGRRRQVHARCVRRVACRSHLRPARSAPR